MLEENRTIGGEDDRIQKRTFTFAGVYTGLNSIDCPYLWLGGKMETLMKGDIILLKRPKFKGISIVWVTIKEIFLFFGKHSGLIQAINKFYHIQFAYDSELSLTQEPPRCHIKKTEKKNLRVYRLIDKPEDFDSKFEIYAKVHMGQKFDFRKFWACVFDMMFGTIWFGSHWVNKSRDMCAELVSRFYEQIGKPCLKEGDSPEHCIPVDIDSFLIGRSNWKMVRDDKV